MRPARTVAVVVVDGNNVVGSVPDGWWRDRPAAVRRLVDRLRAYAETADQPVEVVFDRPQPDLPAGLYGAVVVGYATRRGRDAADERIVERLDQLLADGAVAATVEIITSDRTLADAVRRRGATVVGAPAFLRRLAEAEAEVGAGATGASGSSAGATGATGAFDARD